jgi:hypothetical protein
MCIRTKVHCEVFLYDNAHFSGCWLEVPNRFVLMLLFIDGNLRAFMCFIVMCRGQSKIKYTKKVHVSILTLHLSYNYHKVTST